MKNIFDKKWFKEIVFFIVFLFIINFLFYTLNKVAPYPIDKETAYVSPDESAAIYFLENIKNNKTLFLKPGNFLGTTLFSTTTACLGLKK